MSHGGWSLCLWVDPSKLLIWPPRFHGIHVHDFLLIYEGDRLLLRGVIADLSLELFNYLALRCEQHDTWKIFVTVRGPLVFLTWGRLFCKPAIDLFIIYHYLEFIHSTGWCLAIIPQLHGTDCLGLIKPQAQEVGDAIVCRVGLLLLSLLLSGGRCHCRVRPGVFERCQPNVVLIECLIFTVD